MPTSLKCLSPLQQTLQLGNVPVNCPNIGGGYQLNDANADAIAIAGGMAAPFQSRMEISTR